MRTAAVAAAVAGLVLTMPAATIGAPPELTKQRVAAIALKTLRPGRGVVVFALPQPVAAKQTVGEAFTRPKPAGQRAWLFWADLAPYAYFNHPSRLVLVDARNGRVIRDQRLSSWPVVDRKPPAFLTSRTSYSGSRYRVQPAARPAALAAPSPPRRVPARSAAIPPGSYAGDCLVLIGPYDDAQFKESFPAWESWAKQLGIPSARVTGDADGFGIADAPTAGDLAATVEKKQREGCKDVIVFMTGHGEPPPKGSDDPFADGGSFDGDYSKVKQSDIPRLGTFPMAPGEVVPVTRGANVTSRNLRELLTRFPDLTFKYVIDACYSGRFLNDLKQKQPENLLIAVSSTDAARPAYSRLSAPAGSLGVQLDQPVYAKDGTVDTRLVRIPVPAGRSPTGPTEFTSGMLQAYEAFVASEAQTSEATALSTQTRAPFMVFTLRDMHSTSGRFDITAKAGATKPKVLFTLPIEVSSLSHEHLTAEPASLFCGNVTAPAGASLQVSLRDRASGNTSTSPLLAVGSSGTLPFRYRINHSGTTFPANVTLSVLARSVTLASADYTIPAPPQQGPFRCS